MVAHVAVVIGVGGMGEAIARREGVGRRLLLADFNAETLERVAAALTNDGYEVHTQVVDVSARDSVDALASRAAGLGPVVAMADTAGLSPAQASARAILAVDLVGVGNVLEAFGEVMAPAGAGVVMASMAGSLSAASFPLELVALLRSTPTSELLALPVWDQPEFADPGAAYSLAKRANQVQVQAASVAWGRRGARINSISPGVISTPMGRQELESESGQRMRAMIDASGTGRVGTPTDIANAASFLLSPEASFITGTDLLVDGGVVAAVQTHVRGR